MAGPAFVDTNVFVYADNDSNPVRRDQSKDLIRKLIFNRTGHISLQVLQEYFSVATRKLGIPMDHARRRVVLYATLDVVPLAASDVLAAIDLHDVLQVSIWDALILRAALISGCRRLYTEDLQHGFRIERLEVVNPFL